MPFPSKPLLLLLIPLIPILGAAQGEEIYNTQEMTIPLSSTAETLASVRAPEGFQVGLFASEPMVQQPIGFTLDHKGRLWVAENFTYAESDVRFAEDQKDRIAILEDKDGDGVCDHRKVFAECPGILTSVEIGEGGIWALCAPQLLFFPDRDGDDVADGEPEVILDGWENSVVGHNVVNGLFWGPDGWLYGRHGIQATSVVGKPGAAPSQRTSLNCCIWRYHPQREKFEVVAEGTTNPWGFDFDDHGQMFFINTVIGHLWHVVPGSYYKRMYGAHFRDHLYQLIDHCADHVHWASGERWQDVREEMSDLTDSAGGGHAHCGFMIYLGDNWPETYRNTAFTVNLHGHRLNNDRLSRRGCGYVGTHEPDFLFIEDPWFRGIELRYGPDGSVYLADWTDIGECHESDGVHRTSGRIFKISHGQPEKTIDLDLSRMTDLELADLQGHRNDWYVRQARRLLTERARQRPIAEDALDSLRSAYSGNVPVTHRLRAMWCLALVSDVGEIWLLDQLSDPEEHVRVWAIRLLEDRGPLSDKAVDRLTEMARKEPSGLVRLFLASVLRTLDPKGKIRLAAELCSHAEDAEDPQLPLLLWYGLEPAVVAQPLEAIHLARESRLPWIRECIARRLASNSENDPQSLEVLVTELAKLRGESAELDLLRGMTRAFSGWAGAEPPPSWTAYSESVPQGEKPASELVRTLSVVFGEGAALDQIREVALDSQADPAARERAIRALVAAKAEGLTDLLLKLLEDRSIAAAAASGLAFADREDIPPKILGRYQSLDPEYRREAIDTLATRPLFARALLLSVSKEEISRADISAFHARQIRDLGDPSLIELLEQVWGRVGETAEEKKVLYDKYSNLLTADFLQGGDIAAGRELFQKLCSSCHVLHGEGRNLGPDLTGSDRRNFHYLIENLTDPSATVGEDFRASLVTTWEGSTLTGVLLRRDEKTYLLRTQEEDVILDEETIEEIRPSMLSIMPDGLLEGLKDEEVRDLVSYLMH
jgi:putative membrane-bound dehydrogenase-like protein